MNYRPLGRTGFNVSEVSFGAWAIGGSWGDVDDATSMATLHRAVDAGVNLIDTADVYGDGRSERLVAQLRSERPRDTIYVATKAGRRLDPHTADGYNGINITRFVERSLVNLKADAIDLLQLHCPPNEVYYMPEVFHDLDELTKAGKIRHYGVSVEKVEQAMKAVGFPNVQTVQIIFNLFRTRPAEAFFPLAEQKQVGVLARVPLASGLLTREDLAGDGVRRRRPPQLQPPRRGVRPGRDLQRRAHGRRPRRRRRAAAARARRRHDGPVRPALDPDVRRRDLRDPRCPPPRPGGRQRRRRRPPAHVARRDGPGRRRVRPVDPAAGPPAVVT